MKSSVHGEIQFARSFAKLFLYTVLAGLGVLSILLSIKIITVFQQEIQTLQGTFWYVLYLLVALLGIVACFLILNASEDIIINIALSGGFLLVGLYVLEGILYIVEPGSFEPQKLRDRKITLARKHGVPFDRRSVFQVIADFEAQGIAARPAAFPSLLLQPFMTAPDLFSVFPLSGISNTPTVYCNESGTYITYNSDEHGFNNPRGVFQQQHINAVLVGDSFVQGYCVERDATIAAHLSLPERSVISLGMNGSGPLLEFAILREFARPLRPEVVVWFYYEGNDLRELSEEQEIPILTEYVHEGFSQNLFYRQSEVDDTLISYLDRSIRPPKSQSSTQRNWAAFNLILKLWHVRNRLGMAPSPTPPAPSPLFHEILAKAKALSASWGGKFYVVYLPDWTRYRQKQPDEQFLHRDSVLAMLYALNISVIDIHAVFKKHPDPLSLFPFSLPGHYTPEGYRLVADSIEKALYAP